MPADFSNYTPYTSDSSVCNVVFAGDSPVLEVELNEMQEALKTHFANLIKGVVGNTIIGSKIEITESELNILDGYGYVDGKVIIISKLTATLQPNTNVILRVEEQTVNHNSTLYKYGNVQEEIIPNYIFDSRIKLETTKRKIWIYDLIVASSSIELNPKTDVLIATIGNPVTEILYLINSLHNDNDFKKYVERNINDLNDLLFSDSDKSVIADLKSRIKKLEDSLNDVGGVIVITQAPPGNKNKLWIDSNTSIAYYWHNSEWIPVRGTAGSV